MIKWVLKRERKTYIVFLTSPLFLPIDYIIETLEEIQLIMHFIVCTFIKGVKEEFAYLLLIHFFASETKAILVIAIHLCC